MAYVYKNTSVEALDSFFSGESALDTAYNESIRLLRETEGQSLFETTTRLGELGGDLADVAEEADYFNSLWLSLEGQRVDELMRAGYAKAIELAFVAPPRPMETFWVAEASDNFEMHVTSTTAKVTVFVFVPRTLPRDDPGSRRAQSESWAIRLNDQDDVEVVKVSGPSI
jgi:hypothetical protein